MTRALAILLLSTFAGCGADPALDGEIDPEDDPEVSAGKGDGLSTVPAPLLDAAKKNLKRVAQDIDTVHLYSYGYRGSADSKFYYALRKEFVNQHPDLYVRKLQALASIAFTRRPDLLPPVGGRKMVFHGLDEAAYGRLMSLEDAVFNRLVSQNGSLKGVRPFSVCETRFLVERYVNDPALASTVMYGFSSASWDSYRAAYASYAASCTTQDKDEWYNFRGLGKLRPTWLESNVMDRFVRKYTEQCRSTTDTSPECVAFRADRLAFRDGKNQELGRRMFDYAPDQEQYLADPNQPLVVVPDQNGDGVGEIITPDALLADGSGRATITSTGEFTGRLNASPSKLTAITAIDPRFDPTIDLARNDFGLFRMFPTAGACNSDNPSPLTCPVLKRFYVMIDRHENFYQTYTSLSPTSTSLGKQPSPLVACSVTLAAADHWAHSSPVGTDGFVFVMRVPYKDILSAVPTKVASGKLPEVTTVRQLYQAGTPVDFTRMWVDVASLSSNLYSSEHEISKYGYVRPEQIEGLIYVGTPAEVQ